MEITWHESQRIIKKLIISSYFTVTLWDKSGSSGTGFQPKSAFFLPYSKTYRNLIQPVKHFLALLLTETFNKKLRVNFILVFIFASISLNLELTIWQATCVYLISFHIEDNFKRFIFERTKNHSDRTRGIGFKLRRVI